MSRIVTNTAANSVYKNYTRNNTMLGNSLEKLSTGLRINRASGRRGRLGDQRKHARPGQGYGCGGGCDRERDELHQHG